MTQRCSHDAHETLSKRDHKIVLKKRLEKARRAVREADSKQLFCDNTTIPKDKKSNEGAPVAQDKEGSKRNKPDPFRHAQQQATHYDSQRQLLFDRIQQERLEREETIKEKKDKRANDRRIHLSRTKKGQPRLGRMLEGLLGRIEKQLHQ